MSRATRVSKSPVADSAAGLLAELSLCRDTAHMDRIWRVYWKCLHGGKENCLEAGK